MRASTSQKTPTSKVPHIQRYLCNTPLKCKYCPKINESGFIQSTTNGRNFRTLTSVNCQSANIIYAITCKTCGIQYGDSGDINNNRDEPVARNFNLCPPPPQKPSLCKGFDIKSPTSWNLGTECGGKKVSSRNTVCFVNATMTTQFVLLSPPTSSTGWGPRPTTSQLWNQCHSNQCTTL